MMKLKAWITALIIVFSAVSAIAVAGEAIVPGTNCTATDLAAALNAINS